MSRLVGEARCKIAIPMPSIAFLVPAGPPEALCSDAHHAKELQRVELAALNAERAWVERERVANAWSPERLLAWTAEKSPRPTAAS